jgi:dienelactone hydrolase
MDAATIRPDIEYRVGDAGPQTMDIYYPPDFRSGARIPAVLFVTGYSDPGFKAVFGCRQKEMGSYTSWARLTAASGMAGIAYTNREPAADIQALLHYLVQNAPSLGIDENRMGIWACSGNVPNALSVLMENHPKRLKCAVLCYGYMLDLNGSTGVAKAAGKWGFVNPVAGKSVADFPPDLPLFIARAGRDETPHLNEALDAFLAKAVATNLPITFANHADAPHAFDVRDDSETSREIIRQILAFLRFHLLKTNPDQPPSCSLY